MALWTRGGLLYGFSTYRQIWLLDLYRKPRSSNRLGPIITYVHKLFHHVCNCKDHFLIDYIYWRNTWVVIRIYWKIQEVPAFRDFWYQKGITKFGITNFETNFSAKSQIGSKNFLKSTFLANFSFFESQNTVFLTNFCQAGKNHEKKVLTKLI